MILLMMVDTPEEKRKFVILYENYRYLMLKVAVDILHDYQLAEDAVQEAFVRVKNIWKTSDSRRRLPRNVI
mgnify:CR=1 FL=1